MPRITSATLAESGDGVLATTTIEWAPTELSVNYILRFSFWEDDPKHDDELNYVIDRILPGPHPQTQTDTVHIQAGKSWDDELGEDEIFAKLSLFPDPRTNPGTAFADTNRVAKRW